MKTILTGASTGIGRATARYFAERGWKVMATMRQPQKATEELRHPNIELLTLDVTSTDSVKAAFGEAARRHPRLDVLLNNAGYGLFGPIEAMSEEELHVQWQTNLLGSIRTIQQAIPWMRKQGGGLIINVSSIGGRMAFPFTSAYHASKFGLEGLSESIRFELKPQGIRIKVIEPGGIKTDFGGRSLIFNRLPIYEPQQGNFAALVKGDRGLADPVDVAQVIFRAATDKSDQLRYAAKAGPYFLLHGLMPDWLWRRFGHFMLNRPSSS